MLIVGNFFHGSLDLSFADSFRHLGCEVVTFDYLEEYRNLSPLTRNRYTNRLLQNLFFMAENRKFIQAVRRHHPDLILVFKGAFVFPSTLRRIKAIRNTVLFNFNPDNPFSANRGASNSLIRRSIPFYDCYFIWGKFLVPLLKKAGARRVEYLPFACDPTLHHPVEMSAEERVFYGSDVSFIGTWDTEREKYLEPLADYDLAIWGGNWEKLGSGSRLRGKVRQTGNLGADMKKVCTASKISLNLIREQNGSAHNLKTFEITASGGFMLTTRTEEQQEFFVEGEEIVCFDSPDDLKAKIDLYLKDKDDLISRCRVLAHNRARHQTFTARAKSVLEVYDAIRPQAARQESLQC